MVPALWGRAAMAGTLSVVSEGPLSRMTFFVAGAAGRAAKLPSGFFSSTGAAALNSCAVIFRKKGGSFSARCGAFSALRASRMV